MTGEENGGRPRRPSREEAEAALSGFTMSVAETAVVIARSEAMTRRAVKSGEIKAQRIGRNYRVLCAPLRRQLGIDA